MQVPIKGTYRHFLGYFAKTAENFIEAAMRASRQPLPLFERLNAPPRSSTAA